MNSEQRTNWPVVLTIVGAGILVSFQVGKVPAALPTLAERFGIDEAKGGLLISIFTLMGAAIGVTIGTLGDRLGPRRAMLIGIAVTALGSLLGALSPGPWWLLASRPLEGAGFLLTVVSCPALITAATTGADRRQAFGLWGGYFPTGMAFLILVTPFVMPLLGWRGVWVLVAVLLLIGAAGVAWVTRTLPPPPKASIPMVQGLRIVASSPGVILIGLIFGTYAGQFLTVMGFLPWLLEVEMGLNREIAGALTAFAILLNAVGNAWAGRLLGRGRRRVALVTIGAAALIGSHLITNGFDLPAAIRYGGVLLLSLLGGFIPAAMFAAIPVHTPDVRALGAANGVLVQGTNIGQLTVPLLTGLVVSGIGGWTLAPWVLVPMGVLTLVFGLMLGRVERQLR